MELPFTTDQFFDVFRDYNVTVYPMQVVLYLLAFMVTFLAIKKSTILSMKIINMIMAFLWIWMGVVYHIAFFAAINPMAYIFGSMFILQGLFFIFTGVFQNRISFHYRGDVYGITGLAMMVFALFIYPLLGILGGHAFPGAPTFGLPCPTTIFTFGLFLLSGRNFPGFLFIIPFLWSFFGISAALNLGVREDWFLIVAAVLAGSLLVLRKKKVRQAHSLSGQEI